MTAKHAIHFLGKITSAAAIMTAAFVATPRVAAAADLPMPTKAQPFSQSAPPYDWSGFYGGGHFGYLWGRTRVDDEGVTTERNARTDGIIGGALIGYNWQIDRVVFGLEGDFGWTDAHGVGTTTTGPEPVIIRGPNSYDVRWTSHIRGRLGYAFNDWLVFAAGGFAAADLSFREGAITIIPGTPNAGSGSTPAGTTTGAASSASASNPILDDGGKYYGWSIGGGIEHAFTANLIGRVEYFYDDFGHKDYIGALGDTYRVHLTGQTVRAALEWKFDPFGR